jgi:transcription antitermination factor NusA-like protein
MLKVGIKYCGGCNPYYDRVVLVKWIESRLQGKAKFVSPQNVDVDLVLVVEGCRTACADLSAFDGKKIRIITQSDDAKEFIQEMLG